MAIGTLLAGVVAGLGAPVGAWIGSLARSEFKLGETNIRVLGHIMLAVVGYFLTLEFSVIAWLPLVVALLIGGILAYLDFHVVTHRAPAVAIMVALGLVLVLFRNLPNFAIVASVIFVYGLTAGSLCLVAKNWQRSVEYGCILMASFLLLTILGV